MEPRAKYEAGCSAEPEEEDYQANRDRLLAAAYHALRSYQYGNCITELANAVVNEIEKELIRINYKGFIR